MPKPRPSRGEQRRQRARQHSGQRDALARAEAALRAKQDQQEKAKAS